MKAKAKILIGYDGSGCAEAALDDLQKAGLPVTAEAVVLSVTEISLPPPAPSTSEVLEHSRAVHVPADLIRVYAQDSPAMLAAQALSEQALARLRRNFPAWTISSRSAVGSPARELVRTADEWQPDLIVVGSHGRSAFGRLLLGSVSQSVLTYAHSSVRIARGRVEESDTPLRILVGVDGSEASVAAVREVSSRTWPGLSEVRVIAVDDPLTPTFVGKFISTVSSAIADTNRAYREWLNQVLEDSAARLRQTGLRIVTEIREGDPKRVLVEAAKDWGADSIFVGSVGFGNVFERFFLGSVSAAVAARAHCSVEVVRPPKTNGGNNHEHPAG